MLLYPAIDLMEGRVVRLKQGRAEERTIYPLSPAEYAARWQTEGGDWLHVVDLDAAFSGEHRNLESIRAITAAVKIPVQMGGGMRTLPAIEQALAAGVKRVVIGTKAVEQAAFVAAAVRAFGKERIAVGIDARDGFVSTRGWTKSSKVEAIVMAKHMDELGVGTLIYTDIATDGMMKGPNLPALRALAGEVGADVIASGGVSTLDDIRALVKEKGVSGAIVGKALYDEKLSLAEAAGLVKK